MSTRYLLFVCVHFICAALGNEGFNPLPSRGEIRTFDGDERANFEITRGRNMLQLDDEPLERLYCSSFDAEPSVWDILIGTTPGVIKSTWRALSESLSYLPYSDYISHASSHIVNQLTGIRLPLRAVFGTGYFRVSFSDSDSGDFSAVELFVPQPLVLRSVCLWMHSLSADNVLLRPAISMLCSCSEGVMAIKASYGGTDALWSGCLLHPCTSRDAQEGVCIVEVDALTTSCIYGPQAYRDSVAYELRVPSMQILPSVSSKAPPVDHTSVPPGWRSEDNTSTARGSASSAAIVIPLRAARLLLAFLFMRVSYARHVVSLAAKLMTALWTAIAISSLLSAWNDTTSMASAILAAQRLVRNDISEMTVVGTYVWMNLWNFDARALMATVLCLAAVEAAARWSKRTGASSQGSEADGCEEDSDFESEEETGRHPIWLSLLSFGFSTMAYTVVWVSFGNKIVAVCLCVILSVTARRLLGPPKAPMMDIVPDSYSDTSTYNRVTKTSLDDLSARSRLLTERSLRQLKEYLMQNTAEYEEVVTKLNASGKSNRAHLLKCFRSGSYKGIPELRSQMGDKALGSSPHSSFASLRSLIIGGPLRWVALIAVLVYFVSGPGERNEL